MKKILKHLKENWIRHGFETLVVTVGILGAFALNNWNEERKDRILEKEYLRNINQEFKSNREQFRERMDTFKQLSESCGKVLSSFPITESNWDSTRFIVQEVWGTGTFDPSHASIESLINASSIDIISNASLRNLLLSWPTIIEDWKEEESYITQYVVELTTWMIKNTDSHDNQKLMNPELLFELQNIIGARCYWQEWIINDIETEELVQAMDSIIMMTETYVE